MKNVFYILTAALFLTLVSCEKGDYVNAVPRNSTALITLNAADFASEKSPFGSVLAAFVDKDKKELKGIDLTRDVFLFATTDGNFGFCAPLNTADELQGFLKRMKQYKVVSEIEERDGIRLCTIKDSWLIGFDDEVMLAMGPFTGSDAKSRLTRNIRKLLKKEEESGIMSSVLWEHLQELDSPIRMVAQASALPEQFVSSLTIGAPKGTDPADVLLEAGLTFKDGTLVMDGNTCSYNTNIKQSLENSMKVFKPVTIDWEEMVSDSTFAGVFVNVEGSDFANLLQNSKALNMMLMGTDAYDRIKSNKGNMAILLSAPSFGADDAVKADIISKGEGSGNGENRLVAVLNLNALKGDAAKIAEPFIGKVKKIVYTIK